MIYFDFERTVETKLNISVHNAEVRENREILKDLINVNCFPAKQQLAFCSNDESSFPQSWQLCGTFTYSWCERLARHLETSTVFSGFSNIIQNDLIAAIGDVVRYDIKEISAPPSVAAEVDESTDVANKAQMSVIMWLKARWLVKWRKRFWDLMMWVMTDEPLLSFFSCPSCFHLYMFAYFTWRTASTIQSVCEEN